jgi:hypothetical protein
LIGSEQEDKKDATEVHEERQRDPVGLMEEPRGNDRSVEINSGSLSSFREL